MDENSDELKKAIAELRALEEKGYQFEHASASFEMFVQKALGNYKPFFSLSHYKVLEEYDERGISHSTATIRVIVDDREEITAAESSAGPVNALDRAVRKALEVFYPNLSTMHLVDYNVRVFNTKNATGATVRCTVESTDGKNNWTTVGVAEDIIKASWLALSDSVEYKLLKDARK